MRWATIPQSSCSYCNSWRCSNHTSWAKPASSTEVFRVTCIENGMHLRVCHVRGQSLCERKLQTRTHARTRSSSRNAHVKSRIFHYIQEKLCKKKNAICNNYTQFGHSKVQKVRYAICTVLATDTATGPNNAITHFRVRQKFRLEYVNGHCAAKKTIQINLFDN